MSWLAELGFVPLLERVIARRGLGERTEEVCYLGYGKYHSAGSTITLAGNTSFDSSPYSMYTACVINANASMASELLKQVSPPFDTYSYDLWTSGAFGLCLFSCYDDKFRVGVKRGTSWSDKIALDGEPNCDLRYTFIIFTVIYVNLFAATLFSFRNWFVYCGQYFRHQG